MMMRLKSVNKLLGIRDKLHKKAESTSLRNLVVKSLKSFYESTMSDLDVVRQEKSAPVEGFVTDASVAAAEKAAPAKAAAEKEAFHKKRAAKMQAKKGKKVTTPLSTIVRQAKIDNMGEGFTGPVPNTSVKTPTPEDIAAAQKRDRAKDAARKADPKTPGRNKRQLDRINTAPRGRAKDVVEANVHDVDDTSKQRLQRRGDVVRGRAGNVSRHKQAVEKSAKDHSKAMKARMAGKQKERPRGSSPNFRELRFKNVPGENAPRRDSTELFRNDIINRLKEALRVNKPSALDNAMGGAPKVPTLKRKPVDKNAAIRNLNREMGARAQKEIDDRRRDAEARNRGESPN